MRMMKSSVTTRTRTSSYVSLLLLLCLTGLQQTTCQGTTSSGGGGSIDLDAAARQEADELLAAQQQYQAAISSMDDEENDDEVGWNGITIEDGVPLAQLRNEKKIPLVGLGVGNLQHYLIPLLIASAEQEDKKIRLFDTAHSSDNEHLVAQGILNGMERMGLSGSSSSIAADESANKTSEVSAVSEGTGKVIIHVVTKVWYTHLGYNRTKLSVQSSFDHLREAMNHPMVDLRLHILLHWPRCYDSIAFMNCEDDEESLPNHIKEAGPAPHTDRENAWKYSWKALEDMYTVQDEKYPIESIGLSNFMYQDLQQLDTFATIQPHIIQCSMWSLLYDTMLVDYANKNGIHMQVYNVMNGVLTNPDRAPHAYHHLQKVASELTIAMNYMDDVNSDDPEHASAILSDLGLDELTPAQIILVWLIQHGVSVIPRTSRLSRLSENSAITLSEIPELTDYQVEMVAHSVEAYLSGNDIEQDMSVEVTFHAPDNKNVMIFWHGHDGMQHHVAYIDAGQTFMETTFPNHNYRLYDAQNIETYIDYQVQAKLGEHEDVQIELEL